MMMMSHREDDTVEVDISVTIVRSYYYNFYYYWARRPSQQTDETNTDDDDDHVLRLEMIPKRSIPTVESVGYMMILNNIGHG